MKSFIKKLIVVSISDIMILFFKAKTFLFIFIVMNLNFSCSLEAKEEIQWVTKMTKMLEERRRCKYYANLNDDQQVRLQNKYYPRVYRRWTNCMYIVNANNPKSKLKLTCNVKDIRFKGKCR